MQNVVMTPPDLIKSVSTMDSGSEYVTLNGLDKGTFLQIKPYSQGTNSTAFSVIPPGTNAIMDLRLSLSMDIIATVSKGAAGVNEQRLGKHSRHGKAEGKTSVLWLLLGRGHYKEASQRCA